MSHGYPDYEGQKQRVYLVPEWAAKEAVDKSFESGIVLVGFNAGTSVSYVVPAGKTLYITQFGFRGLASVVGDSDLNQMCYGWIDEITAGLVLWQQGGNGGGGATFPKPIAIPAGHQVDFYVYGMANHNLLVLVTAAGYEV